MQPAPLPHQLAAAPFSTSQARSAGVSGSRLRRQDLTRPHHGARVAREPTAPDLDSRCRRFLPVMPTGGAFSHTTALRLHGVSVSSRLTDDVLHVAVPPPARAPRRPGIVGHQCVAIVEEVRGLPVVGAVDAWCQLASLATEDELVMAGDALLRRQGPLARYADLASAVETAARRRGIRRLRAALPLVRARTDSPMETVLRLAIIRSGLPEPVVNYAIDVGERLLLADLAYPRHKVVVEYDGDQHRSDARQYERDIDRLWQIESRGWRVIRVNRSHLAGGAGRAVARVRAALRSS